MRTCDRRTAAGLALLAFAASFWQPWTLLAQAPEPARVRYAQISQADLKEWLTYLASDTLQGRQVFTRGLRSRRGVRRRSPAAWGVKPLGDDGTYFENVRLRGYRVTRNSSVTSPANGQIRRRSSTAITSRSPRTPAASRPSRSTASSSSATASLRTLRAATSRTS